MADKPNRNEPCYCGSGKKYKNCCKGKDDSKISSKLGIVVVAIVLALGLLIIGLALSGGGTQDCPPGTVWSNAHQHCH